MPSVEVKPSPQGVPGAVNDPTRISAEDLTFAGAGSTQVNGYLARPADAASHPGMIVIHEAGGLGEHIRDVCNRFANIGYVTLGVDLYTREGDPPDTSDPQKLFARLFSMSDEIALGDLEGAADHLRSLDGVSGRIGCIGFCMGGRYTLLLACASEKLNAAVDCWGGFIDRAEPEERSSEQRPTPPLEMVAGSLECPLLAAVGAEDQNPSPELGARLREEAERSPAARAGQEIKVDVYEGASHAFFADYRPSYRPEPATKLWAEVVPFLARHLQSG
ncbi:MAG TPA: dienelactone hydrolase family protein [Solirubrobacteraceae bacterium]|nr:dienelactone hydrolase family protein [Solirubrobacteraceae bacterium]